MKGFVLGAAFVALWLAARGVLGAEGTPLALEATAAGGSGAYATRGVKGGRGAAWPAAGETLFPLGRGWLGGDAAYSIPLRDKRILWLFGDTFTDVNREGIRRWKDLVGNSVGVSESGTMGWSTSFYYGEADGEGLPFFRSPEPLTRYWPRAGFEYGNTLFVFLTKAKYTGVGPFGFEVTGSALASFDARDISSVTPVTYDDFPTPANFLIGSAVARSENQILIYSVLDDSQTGGPRPVYLSRYRDGHFDYLADEIGVHVWKRGLVGDDAVAVLDHGVSEFSVHYHQPTQQWLMVYSDSDISSGKIWLRKAEQPEGPWSDPILFYSVDEVAGPDHVPFAFTYAAKAHPELATDARVPVTYIVNLAEDPSDPEEYDNTDLWRILKPAFYGFYVPQLVSLDVPGDE